MELVNLQGLGLCLAATVCIVSKNIGKVRDFFCTNFGLHDIQYMILLLQKFIELVSGNVFLLPPFFVSDMRSTRLRDSCFCMISVVIRFE